MSIFVIRIHQDGIECQFDRTVTCDDEFDAAFLATKLRQLYDDLDISICVEDPDTHTFTFY